MRRRVKCSAAAAEQTDEQGEGTFRRINTGIIIILYRSSVASWTNSLILCRAVATGEEGVGWREEVPDVETVDLRKMEKLDCVQKCRVGGWDSGDSRV